MSEPKTLAPDAPTSEIAQEDVRAFLDEFNEFYRERDPYSRSIAANQLIGEHGDRRTAIDVASPPKAMNTEREVPVAETYQDLVDAGELVAAATLRRITTLDTQLSFSEAAREYLDLDATGEAGQ